MELAKVSQITTTVRQCFDILNTYGKSPDQLKSLMRAMVEDLSGYSVEKIDAGFLEWRRTSEKIPTPADILKIVRRNSEGDRKKYSDFDGNWTAYKSYLKSIGDLNENIV